MNPRDAFHRTVHSFPGGVEALAPRVGMQAGVLRNKANPTSPYNKPMLDDVDLVMGITGDHSVLHALAANHGYVCVRMENDVAPSDMAVLEIMAKCWSANGDFGTSVNNALADGRITIKEIEQIREAVRRMDQAAHQLVARMEGLAQK